jgi:uncharacterized protein YaeQ
MRPDRREYRLTLSHVDRGVNVERPVLLSRHPLEDDAHLATRMLAYCLLHEERLEFGPGLDEGDEPDLLARDLTGTLVTWVGCGALSPKRVRKVLQHNRAAAVHAVFDLRARRDAFVAEVASWGERAPRGWDRLHLWTLPEAVVERLAALEAPRQRWLVTIVGEHLYVDAEGEMVDGALVRG